MKHQSSNISFGLGHVQSTRTSTTCVAIAMVTFAILLFSGVAQVEGGCSRFGHSCFGAHGKRADTGPIEGRFMDNLPNNGDVLYPQAAGTYANYQNANAGVRLPPYFLEWLLANRRDQELKSHDQGSLIDGSGAGGASGASAPMDMRK